MEIESPLKISQLLFIYYSITKVYKIDARRSLVYVKGAVPGRAGRVVRIQFQLVILGMESKVMKKMKNY